jgi:hypothetical protein
VIVTALGLSSSLVIADALVGGPLSRGGLPRQLGGLALLIGSLVALSGVLTSFRRAWHHHLRRNTDRAISRLTAWTRKISRGRRPGVSSPPLRLGERVALLSGLVLTALDIVLTALLLRDVFPEPPYRFDLFGLLSPSAVEWSFYIAVASFKAILEVWFGVVDRIKVDAEGQRSTGWAATRWFVLGGASAFDAMLAASRGLLLAEQGLDGAAVTVSNILFIGFGIAVPWVAAMTGALLVSAADPLLARLGPLRLLSSLLRLAAIVIVWAVALSFGLPFLASLAVLGLLTVTWFAIEDGVGVVMGHDDAPPPDTLVLVEPQPSEPRPPDDTSATDVLPGAHAQVLQ